jgi:hypothetical protein
MTRENEGHGPVGFLKRTLLAGWALWLTVVFATNLLDGLKALALLPGSWAFASGNYGFVAETTGRYGTPAWVNGLLFAGVIAWEGAAAVLFWAACCTFKVRGKRNPTALYAAFTAGLSLWLAFALADEVFISYPIEGTHLRLFVAQLVTLLAVEWLPGPTSRVGSPG